jgi:hypothetical protein
VLMSSGSVKQRVTFLGPLLVFTLALAVFGGTLLFVGGKVALAKEARGTGSESAQGDSTHKSGPKPESAPPGHGENPPPGDGGNPPGHNEDPPPGHGGTPPGHGEDPPPGHGGTPPGHSDDPPPGDETPPTPPPDDSPPTPPGHGDTPPGHGEDPPPGHGGTPPGHSDDPPPGDETPPTPPPGDGGTPPTPPPGDGGTPPTPPPGDGGMSLGGGGEEPVDQSGLKPAMLEPVLAGASGPVSEPPESALALAEPGSSQALAPEPVSTSVLKLAPRNELAGSVPTASALQAAVENSVAEILRLAERSLNSSFDVVLKVGEQLNNIVSGLLELMSGFLGGLLDGGTVPSSPANAPPAHNTPPLLPAPPAFPSSSTSNSLGGSSSLGQASFLLLGVLALFSTALFEGRLSCLCDELLKPSSVPHLITERPG